MQTESPGIFTLLNDPKTRTPEQGIQAFSSEVPQVARPEVPPIASHDTSGQAIDVRGDQTEYSSGGNDFVGFDSGFQGMGDMFDEVHHGERSVSVLLQRGLFEKRFSDLEMVSFSGQTNGPGTGLDPLDLPSPFPGDS